MQKTCSKCQTLFECKNEAPGCWCESVYLSTSTLTDLSCQFSNCLCPSCLKSYEVPKVCPPTFGSTHPPALFDIDK
ncbi:cysteine-rich CWC family protein [Stenotrophomonas maltophilia]|uniref:cysteine-rich CWC family protein n=1 Tax=Stenotrophomonas maltophilia TaxID=40324 RepID=UPI0013DD7B27